MFSAIRESIRGGISPVTLRNDALSGITVGIIALPLSMALAIATGVPPQHGLYTAIVAGIVIALSGGSLHNISGPTAAFVVILVPIVTHYGMGGLLIAGFLSGAILVAMGGARLGVLIQVVPYPVTVGFTAGIAVVIATLQAKDFLGLTPAPGAGNYLSGVARLLEALPHTRWEELLIGALTLATLIAWMRLRSRVPGHLVALLAGTGASLGLAAFLPDFHVTTIGSRFFYDVGGATGAGIPPFLPQFVLPWHFPGPDGAPLGLSYQIIRDLIPAAFSIAVLGALESLLSATIADAMAGTRHDPNDELIGQGLGNMAAPFLGGIPATAALARTAANIRAGARTPFSSVVHALFIVLSILALAPLLSHIPMTSMAALLLMVAWNMSETKHFIRILKVASRSDRATLVTCFALTVLFDMEIAIAVGMALAALLFIRRTIELTDVRLLERHEHAHLPPMPEGVILYDINGPLFFGAAQKALSGLTRLRAEIRAVLLDLSDVSMIDMTALVAMETILATMKSRGVALIVCNANGRVEAAMRKAGITEEEGIRFAPSIEAGTALASVPHPAG